MNQERINNYLEGAHIAVLSIGFWTYQNDTTYLFSSNMCNIKYIIAIIRVMVLFYYRVVLYSKA